MNFGHHWFHDGSKLIAGIRKMTKSTIIPFGRDYKNYVISKVPTARAAPSDPDKKKVFIVHGHDEARRPVDSTVPDALTPARTGGISGYAWVRGWKRHQGQP